MKTSSAKAKGRKLQNLLVKSLKKYRHKLRSSQNDSDQGENKVVLIGKKYRKEDAIDQLNYAIYGITQLFQDIHLQ